MNINKTLKKLEEKKEIIIMRDGAVVTAEKFEEMKKKEYLSKAKEGELDLTKITFSTYFFNELEKTHTVTEMLALLANPRQSDDHPKEESATADANSNITN